VARELTLGMVKAYSNYLTLVENDIIIRRLPKEKGKVHIVFDRGSAMSPA